MGAVISAIVSIVSPPPEPTPPPPMIVDLAPPNYTYTYDCLNDVTKLQDFILNLIK